MDPIQQELDDLTEANGRIADTEQRVAELMRTLEHTLVLLRSILDELKRQESDPAGN